MSDVGDIFTLQKERIDEFWASILALLSKFEAPDWTPEQVYDDLKCGKAQLWGIADIEIKGIWITRIELKPVKHGFVWIAAGSGLETGTKHFACTEAWFREQGCQYIEIIGRKGWERVLPGYKPYSVVLRKSLWAAHPNSQIM